MKGLALSQAQRSELLSAYLSRGFAAASSLAIEFGVSPKVMSKYARADGHKGKPGREPKAKVVKVRTRASRQPQIIRRKKREIEEKLWQRAISRGEVGI